MTLRMFVWTDVLRDYTAGLAVALAHDENEARALLRADPEIPRYAWEEFDKTPDVYDTPTVVWVHGGG